MGDTGGTDSTGATTDACFEAHIDHQLRMMQLNSGSCGYVATQQSSDQQLQNATASGFFPQKPCCWGTDWGTTQLGGTDWGATQAGTDWGNTQAGTEWGTAPAGTNWGNTQAGTDSWGTAQAGTDSWGTAPTGTDHWEAAPTGTDWGGATSHGVASQSHQQKQNYSPRGGEKKRT
eukprot:g18149.t1